MAEQEPFVKATRDILGEHQCYAMLKYGRFQASSAFKQVCIAYNMKSQYGQEIIEEISQDPDKWIDDEIWGKIVRYSKKLVGVIENYSQHSCAFLLLDKDIRSEIGVIRTGNAKKGYMQCAVINKNTADEFKYLKNDYLIVTVWDIISKVSKAAGLKIPDIRELSKMVADDQKVWDLYADGITATLNQVATDSGRPQVMQYKPRSIAELSAWVAAIRPQFQSMKHLFLGRIPFSYNIPEFDKILETSKNFVLYQENIMATLIFAGFDEDITYSLLKAISKKTPGVFEKVEEQFLKGFGGRTGDPKATQQVWRILQDAAR